MTAIIQNIMELVNDLSNYDKAKLLDAIYSTLTTEKENEILKKWALEAENRLQSYDQGILDSEDFESIKKQIK